MVIEERDFYKLKSDVQSHSRELTRLGSRMGEVEKKQEMLYEMNQNIAIIANSLKQVEGDIGEVKETQKDLTEKVLTLENAPAKETLDNLKKIKIAAITAVATMLATGAVGVLIAALAK